MRVCALAHMSIGCECRVYMGVKAKASCWYLPLSASTLSFEAAGSLAILDAHEWAAQCLQGSPCLYFPSVRVTEVQLAYPAFYIGFGN